MNGIVEAATRCGRREVVDCSSLNVGVAFVVRAIVDGAMVGFGRCVEVCEELVCAVGWEIGFIVVKNPIFVLARWRICVGTFEVSAVFEDSRVYACGRGVLEVALMLGFSRHVALNNLVLCGLFVGSDALGELPSDLGGGHEEGG